MPKTLVVNGQRVQLEIEGDRFGLHSRPLGRYSAVQTAPGVWSILIGARSYTARVMLAGSSSLVLINGRSYKGEPDEASDFASGAIGPATQRITAVMPGRVVRVLAQVGQSVDAGQGLLVVEAMKMQNEVKARAAGRVTRMCVQEGQTVAAGQLLAVVET